MIDLYSLNKFFSNKCSCICVKLIGYATQIVFKRLKSGDTTECCLWLWVNFSPPLNKKAIHRCFTCVVFIIELNFPIAFLLIRKPEMADLSVKMGDPSNGGMIWNGGVDTPLQTMNMYCFSMPFWKTHLLSSAEN